MKNLVGHFKFIFYVIDKQEIFFKFKSKPNNTFKKLVIMWRLE